MEATQSQAQGNQAQQISQAQQAPQPQPPPPPAPVLQPQNISDAELRLVIAQIARNGQEANLQAAEFNKNFAGAIPALPKAVAQQQNKFFDLDNLKGDVRRTSVMGIGLAIVGGAVWGFKAIFGEPEGAQPTVVRKA